MCVVSILTPCGCQNIVCVYVTDPRFTWWLGWWRHESFCVSAGCKYTCHVACRDRVSLDCNALSSPVSQDHLNNNAPPHVSTLHAVRVYIHRKYTKHKYFNLLSLSTFYGQNYKYHWQVLQLQLHLTVWATISTVYCHMGAPLFNMTLMLNDVLLIQDETLQNDPVDI